MLYTEIKKNKNNLQWFNKTVPLFKEKIELISLQSCSLQYISLSALSVCSKLMAHLLYACHKYMLLLET